MSGILPLSLERPARDRLSLLANAGQRYTLDEYVYARAAAMQAGAPTLRVKNMRTLSSPALSNWSLQIDQVPEPRRTAPRALQFGVTQIAIDGGHSPHSLATALGYEHCQFSLRKTGWVYRRGDVEIQLYRLGPTPSSEHDNDRPYPDTLLITAATRYRADTIAGDRTDTARTAGGGDAGDRREKALASLEEVASHLKGLVDLSRADYEF